MKSAALLLCVIACGMASFCWCADLSQVQTVYLLPMSNGLDQYLANRLTSAGVFHVTADPKKAQAVFTDKLGQDFEERLNTLYASPEAKPDASKAKGEADQPLRSSAFGRAKGTLFLVDTATRGVLWSIYAQPRNTSPAELDRTAQRIVDRLKASVKHK